MRFIGFVSYTPEAWAHMINESVDREPALRELTESAGGKLEQVYWLLSEWDVALVFELPSELDAMALGYGVYSLGGVRHFEFHPILDHAQNAAMQRKAKACIEGFKHVTHPDSPKHP